MEKNYFVVHMKSDSNPGRVITFDKLCTSYEFDSKSGSFKFLNKIGEDSRTLLATIPSQNVLWIENVISDRGEWQNDKTRAEKLTTMFPNLALDSDGIPYLCPHLVDSEWSCVGDVCEGCREKYWSRGSL